MHESRFDPLIRCKRSVILYWWTTTLRFRWWQLRNEAEGLSNNVEFDAVVGSPPTIDQIDTPSGHCVTIVSSTSGKEPYKKTHILTYLRCRSRRISTTSRPVPWRLPCRGLTPTPRVSVSGASTTFGRGRFQESSETVLSRPPGLTIQE